MRSRIPIMERMAQAATRWTGGSLAFSLALGVVAVWLVTGPLFGFSDTWQLVINTGTTIITFLMVFLIQRTQNKDALALQLKLNELVAAVRTAIEGGFYLSANARRILGMTERPTASDEDGS